jgi:hypothetical protein
MCGESSSSGARVHTRLVFAVNMGMSTLMERHTPAAPIVSYKRLAFLAALCA